MRSSLCALFALCACLSTASSVAQIGPPPPVPNFCNGGLIPDGFIDWSALPPAPNLSLSTPSTPVTATLPVTGIPGLTVTVGIPALITANPNGMPAYTVSGDSLQLNGLDAGGNTVVGLSFNNPVRGLSAVILSGGKTPFGGGMTVFDKGTGAAVQFNGSPATPQGGFASVEAPVEARASFASINGAELSFTGVENVDEYLQVTFANVRIESGSAPDPALAVPTDGLMLWLRGDNTGSGVYWQDLSPVGEAATGNYLTQPGWGLYDGPTCSLVYSFQGNQFLNFNRTIDGLNQLTILLVAKSDQTPGILYTSQNSAIFWQEDARWGNTYLSPHAGYVTYRFGTGQVNNDQVYMRPMTIGGDYSITMSVHDGSSDSLYVNGIKVQQRDDKLPVLSGTTGAAVLGEGLNGTPFNGKIGEVMVWNRVLTPAERKAVDQYLMQKYGIQ